MAAATTPGRRSTAKRHVAVNTGGVLLAVVVTASVQDRDAAPPLLWNLRNAFRWQEHSQFTRQCHDTSLVVTGLAGRLGVAEGQVLTGPGRSGDTRPWRAVRPATPIRSRRSVAARALG